jgi:hypothetical protein
MSKVPRPQFHQPWENLYPSPEATRTIPMLPKATVIFVAFRTQGLNMYLSSKAIFFIPPLFCPQTTIHEDHHLVYEESTPVSLQYFICLPIRRFDPVGVSCCSAQDGHSWVIFFPRSQDTGPLTLGNTTYYSSMYLLFHRKECAGMVLILAEIERCRITCHVLHFVSFQAYTSYRPF